MGVMFTALFVVAIPVLIMIAHTRRSQCTWPPERNRTYRVLSVLGLLFFPWQVGTLQPFPLLCAGITLAAIYGLALSIFRGIDLKHLAPAVDQP